MLILGLLNDQYLFGRGLKADYVFDMTWFPPNSAYFKSLSSRHFRIFKVGVSIFFLSTIILSLLKHYDDNLAQFGPNHCCVCYS